MTLHHGGRGPGHLSRWPKAAGEVAPPVPTLRPLTLNALGLAILGYVQFDPIGALAVWNMLPFEVRRVLPPNFLTIVGMVLFALSMLARLVRQPRLERRR